MWAVFCNFIQNFVLLHCMRLRQQDIGRKRNLLRRYKAVVEEFNKYDCRIIPITTIHREYIYPKFHISRDTLYRILNTPIDEELEKITMPSLFDAEPTSLFNQAN